MGWGSCMCGRAWWAFQSVLRALDSHPSFRPMLKFLWYFSNTSCNKLLPLWSLCRMSQSLGLNSRPLFGRLSLKQNNWNLVFRRCLITFVGRWTRNFSFSLFMPRFVICLLGRNAALNSLNHLLIFCFIMRHLFLSISYMVQSIYFCSFGTRYIITRIWILIASECGVAHVVSDPVHMGLLSRFKDRYIKF